ncbi:MAG TPA: hypothetical protein VLS48_01650 [Anaerolineales bacterium]|nr:hypothetical protein [Anaerolineales bacterium]
MDFRFDDKGKFYTEVVTKEAIAVLVQTQTYRIRGFMYVRPENRLIDELNLGRRFLPLTDVVVVDHDGSVLERAEFLTINCDQVVWIAPAQDIVDDPSIGGDA